MELVPFKRAHIESFLLGAVAEGWVSDQQEMEFLLNTYPAGCLVNLDDGEPTAFITAIKYERSAWIGNLLVLPGFRQRGLGRALMEKVLHCLEFSGAETVWLTASADGAHLYKTLGFMQIDRVQRWRGFISLPPQQAKAVCRETLAAIDSMGWGDNRLAIYDFLDESSILLTSKEGFLACSSGNFQHIGPWGAISRETAVELLDAATDHDTIARETLIDVPTSNIFAGELLRLKGFSVTGATLLMYRGPPPEYRAEYLYSLASMGSYG